MQKITQLVSYMKTDEQTKDIQLKQTSHRMRLIKEFNIVEGEHILEIGCGQGDTTVVLADAVGKKGHVHAVDIASSDYGAPMTLKEATDYISESEIGNRITFQFETDVMDDKFQGTYDAVILSHSLFYFSSRDELRQLFLKIQSLTDRIYLADWDLSVKNYKQTAHAQAILLQVLHAQTTETDANIRLLITKDMIIDLLEATNWSVVSITNIDASDLDDSAWEVDQALNLENTALEPALSGFKNLLQETEKLGRIESLDSFVIKGSKINKQ